MSPQSGLIALAFLGYLLALALILLIHHKTKPRG